MKFSFVRLSTKDLATLADRVIATSQKDGSYMVTNHPFLQKLLGSFTVYDEVFTKKAYSGMGKDVAETDRLRDMAFKGMKEVLHGLMRVDGLSNQKDALDLFHIFEAHGLELDGYSYSSESAQGGKLIKVLDLPENQMKLEHVHLTEMFTVMKMNFQAFEQVYSMQSTANSGLRQQKSASAVRGDLEVDLRNYLNLVDVMSGIDSSWVALNAELSEHMKAAKNSKLSSKQTTPPEPAN